MGRFQLKYKMKLFAAALAASASASTLFAGVYNSIAGQIKDQVVSVLQSVPDAVPALAAFQTEIDAFADALAAIPNDELVALIDNVDITTLVDDNGDFNANALATVFSTMDPTVVENLRTSFVNNLDATQMASVTTSMEYFTELSSVFQDIMNNEIEISNFMAMYNDVAGALVNFDDAFGNALLPSWATTVMDYGQYVTVAAEKAVVLYEEIVSGDLPMEFTRAVETTYFSVGQRISEMDGDESENFMCRAGQTRFFTVAEKTFEYAPDAIVANFRIPVVDAVNFYNDFVHGLPFGLSDTVQTVSVDNINSVFDGLDNALYAISGSFTEIRSLAELTNMDVPVNNFLINAYC